MEANSKKLLTMKELEDLDDRWAHCGGQSNREGDKWKQLIEYYGEDKSFHEAITHCKGEKEKQLSKAKAEVHKLRLEKEWNARLVRDRRYLIIKCAHVWCHKCAHVWYPFSLSRRSWGYISRSLVTLMFLIPHVTILNWVYGLIIREAIIKKEDLHLNATKGSTTWDYISNLGWTHKGRIQYQTSLDSLAQSLWFDIGYYA